MKITKTDISDVLVLEPDVLTDDRGFFMESFSQKEFNEVVGREVAFVQDNHSRSKAGVLRGLHYQLPPMAQGKLVRCIVGEIYDVAVDIRRSSATFGQWFGERLTAANKHQLWVPEGFAHGFLVLSEVAEVLYKTTEYYAPEHERSIRCDDPDLKVEWPCETSPTLSDKDAAAPLFHDVEVFD